MTATSLMSQIGAFETHRAPIRAQHADEPTRAKFDQLWTEVVGGVRRLLEACPAGTALAPGLLEVAYQTQAYAEQLADLIDDIDYPPALDPAADAAEYALALLLCDLDDCIAFAVNTLRRRIPAACPPS